jgi:hypothetical protein
MSTMRKIFALPLAAVVAVGFVACDSNPAGLAPEGPNFELVSGGMDRDDANVDIVATFSYTIEGTGEPFRTSGDAVNPSGKVVGQCGAGGAMINAAGRPTGANPHPFCMSDGVTEDLIISLEPISGAHEIYCHHDNNCDGGNRIYQEADKVTFDADGDLFVTYNKAQNHQPRNWYMEGQGQIHAWAVDQHGNRHGTFTFSLAQFANIASGSDANPAEDYFDHFNLAEEGEPEYIVWGLNKEITATYTYPDGVTTVQRQGWIYWDLIEEDED